MSKSKTQLKHYVVTYTITKCELVSDMFVTANKRAIKKELDGLVDVYNKRDEASQIVDLQIISVEKTNG